MIKETKHFITYFPEEENDMAEKFINLLEEKNGEIRENFGFGEATQKYNIQICNSIEEYIEKTGKKKEEYQSWMVGFSNSDSFTISILSPNVAEDRSMEDMEKVAVHELVHMIFDDVTKVAEDDAELWLAEGIAILYAKQTEMEYISRSEYPKLTDLIRFDNFADNQGYDYAGIYVWYFIRKFGFETFVRAYRGECNWQELIQEGFEAEAIEAYSKREIAYLFRNAEPVSITAKNSSHGENDFREALFVEYEDEKIVIKLADNGFTDEEHLTMWMTIAEKYKELGYYCPQYRKALDGTFPRISYAGHECIVYAEEYSVYRSAEEIIKEKYKETGLMENGYYTFLRDAALMNARVAAQHYDFTELPSAYCMFQTFEPQDEVDEVTENALDWKKEADKLPPQYREQVERIWANWQEARRQLSEIYSELPTSVFQADINDTNVLLDEEGNFKGVYDFNIGGKEVFMNLIFREAPYVSATWEEFDKEDFFSRSIKKVLQISSEVYEFNELEKMAAPLLYRCIKPLYWYSLDLLKEAGDKDAEIQKCLDFIEYEQTREIDFWTY